MLFDVVKKLDLNSKEGSVVESNQEFFEALERSFVFGNSVSISFWQDQIGMKEFLKLTYILDKYDIANISINKIAKWGEISLNKDFLINQGINIVEFKALSKMVQYAPKVAEEWNQDERDDLVRSNGKVKETGLVRTGFVKASHIEFSYDIKYLDKYKDMIIENTTKGITKVMSEYDNIGLDITNYKEISEAVIRYICMQERWYSLEGNISDSRGRAIYRGLKRVFNPVSFKDARALMNFREGRWISTNSIKALKEIYLFIAELNGSKADNWNKKELAGKLQYKAKILPELNNDNLHEYIWLERIYEELDRLFNTGEVYWTIPIEVDATASMIQIQGVLLNDYNMLNETNCINPKELKDFWEPIKGVERDMVKCVWTPRLYGSAASTKNLLLSKNFEPTKELLKAMKPYEDVNKFKLPSLLRDINIKYNNINTPSFNVNIWGERFNVEVNKFKGAGATVKVYSAFVNDKIETFMNHSITKIPDYNRFKYYLHTLLVHNLDSQIANKVCLSNECISIHDAFLVLPDSNVRGDYMELLEALRINGKEVLKEYWESINVDTNKAAMKIVELWDSVVECKESIEESSLK